MFVSMSYAGSRCRFAVRSFFILLLLFCPAYTRADDNTPEVEIKVVGKNLSETIPSVEDVNLTTTTSVYNKIDVSARQGEFSSISDTLEKETGLQIKRAGSAGSFATVSVRGTASNQVSVYVDGIPLNSGRSGYIDLSEIPLDAVDTIEVFRSSTPSSFAEGGLGGVINIKTKKGTSEDLYSLIASVEAFMTFSTSFSGCNQLPSGDVYYSFSHFQTQGSFPFLNDMGTEYNPNDDKEDIRENNDSLQSTLDLKLRMYSGDDTVVILSETFTVREQGIPGRMNNQSQSARYNQKLSLLNLSIEKGSPDEEGWSTVLRSYWKNDTDEFLDPDAEVSLSEQHVRSDISETGLFGLAVKKSKGYTFTLNGVTAHEVFTPKLVSGSSSHAYIPYPSSRTKSLASVSGEFELDTWIISSSLRGGVVQNRLESSSVSDSAEIRTFTGQVGVKYLLSSEYSFKSNVGSYHRVPSMGELFGDWGFFLGSPDLKPEYGVNTEICFEASAKKRLFPLFTESYSVTIFRMEIHDYIAYIFNAQGIGRPDNIGKAEITGIELCSSHRYETFSFNQSLTFQQPLDKTTLSYNYGNILPGRAQLIYSGELSWRVKKVLRLFGGILIETGTYYDSPNFRSAPDKYPMSAGIEYRHTQDMKIIFRIENIFDNQYEDYGGYPLPGRILSLSFTMDF